MAKLQDDTVVYTNKARCRDCNRCVRVCPVKAIRIAGGQAHVDAERCISCGTCVRECPQGAKTYRRDVKAVGEALAGSRPVAASVAPSFAAVLEPWQQKRLASALRRLGFAHVSETSVGAYYTAGATAAHVRAGADGGHICSACPAVVGFVQRHRPELTGRVVPVVSPMVAHAKLLRERLGEAVVVFIGPCIAKKAEADAAAAHGGPDLAITFEELLDWLAAEGIDLGTCEESEFDMAPAGDASLFPLAGGELRTGQIGTDPLAPLVLSVSGAEEVASAIDDLAAGAAGVLEPLWCSQGCVNGPAAGTEENPFVRRRRLLAYAAERTTGQAQRTAIDLAATIRPLARQEEPISDQQIQQVLARTGKADPENQLNCGACGYPTCREKAIAVIRGLAETEMCIPYMRRLAEQRVDRIIDTSPNGIVVLDSRLRILSMNPAFRKMFMCSDALAGRHISTLMDPDPFEQVASGSEAIVARDVEHAKYGLMCHQMVYALGADDQYVGIFVNRTGAHRNQAELDRLKSQTILQARQMLEHQTEMAQRMAELLGENVAHGERLLEDLLDLADGSDDGQGG